MNIPVIEELQVVGVADRGIANKERILLRPLISMNLQNFVLTLGVVAENATKILPLPNFVFFFEDIVVEAMSWVVVYTGPGESEVSRLPTTFEKAYSYHWGNSSTLFAGPLVLPVLFRITAIGFARADLPGWPQLLPSGATIVQPPQVEAKANA